MATNPKISNVEEVDDVLKFTLSNINLSYANAIRRVLLSDVPCIVFKTQPYEENNVNIKVNKTRMNNELIKQRISCVPINIDIMSNDTFPYDQYIVELSKKNSTSEIIYATTEDFKIKNIETNKYLNDSEVKQLFPPDKITGDYIDIIRLRPKLSDNLDEEELTFEAKLTVSSASEDGMFNVVSTCAYGNTIDVNQVNEAWKIKEEELKNSFNKEVIDFMKKDWLLTDAKRLYINDSFDFVIETLGIYSNFKLMEIATSIIIKKLYGSLESLKTNSDLISEATDTMDNCYVITLENEDYTVGKILEYYLYNKYFEEKKIVSYIGFLKKHPHDTFSIIKIAFKTFVSKDEIITLVEEAVDYSIIILNEIKKYFTSD
jgi:DNA-directed RNA polymerase subunit L